MSADAQDMPSPQESTLREQVAQPEWRDHPLRSDITLYVDPTSTLVVGHVLHSDGLWRAYADQSATPPFDFLDEAQAKACVERSVKSIYDRAYRGWR